MAFVQYNNRRRCILILIICDALVYYNIIYWKRVIYWRERLLAAARMENNITIISRHASTGIIMGAKWTRCSSVETLNRLPFTRWPSVIFHKNEIKKKTKQSDGNRHSDGKVDNCCNAVCWGGIASTSLLSDHATHTTHTHTNAIHNIF